MMARRRPGARIVLVMSQKGGVGKTTVTVNLAAVVADTIATRGRPVPVLGLSIDPQASMLEWAQRVGSALPFDFDQCEDPGQLARLRSLTQYSHIFVDTPGALPLEDEDDDRPASTAQSAIGAALGVADEVILVLEPEPMSFNPAARTIRKVIEPAGVPYRVLINNWDTRDGDIDLVQTKEYCQAQGFPMFNTVIRHYMLHKRASVQGVTAVQYGGRNASHAREDFLKLSLEVVGTSGRRRHALTAVNGVYTATGTG